MEMDRSPRGRVAVVTGAASGIGRATAELLTAEGALVAGLDRVTGCDVTDAAQVDRALAEVRSTHGPVDILVNAAGIAVGARRQGLTANAVCPGATLTGMTEAIPAADRDRFAARHVPVGRYGRPEEIAHVILSLVVPAASFVNGAVIPVDGGQSARSQ